MLSYISHKFSQETKPQPHEPRAALFLNRFTRTLTIVYATNGLANILGVSADQLRGKSFYYCIQENCLKDAVKCLESAKANDSIAYLRFWFRDPRYGDPSQDEHMDGYSSGEDEDGGVQLDGRMEDVMSEQAVASDSSISYTEAAEGRNSTQRSADPDPHHLAPQNPIFDPNSRSSSGNSTDLYSGSNEAIFDAPATCHSSVSSMSFSTPEEGQRSSLAPRTPGPLQIELEAVVSCTSDGLVVVLRRARALVPQIAQPTTAPVRQHYENGFFASPWATNPMIPNVAERRHDEPAQYQPGLVPLRPTVAQADTAAMHGPDQEDFMNSIREVAVFAWSLTGINGSLAKFGRGTPTGESLPPNGLPIWKPDSHTTTEMLRHPHHGNNPQEKRQSRFLDERSYGLTGNVPGRNGALSSDRDSHSHEHSENGHLTNKARNELYGNYDSSLQHTSHTPYTNEPVSQVHEPEKAPNQTLPVNDGGTGDEAFRHAKALHHCPSRFPSAVDAKDTYGYSNDNSDHHDNQGSNGNAAGIGNGWMSISHYEDYSDGTRSGRSMRQGPPHYESAGGYQYQ